MLITMTFVKLGDFLLLTPVLRELQKINSKVLVAIPDLLFELYQEQKIFSHFISQKKAAGYAIKHGLKILDLTYPLLDKVAVPQHHLRLDPEFFKKPQHSTESYLQALRFWFPELPENFKSKPFLDVDTDEITLSQYQLKPFQYFTVHSGSDCPPKNWSTGAFEETIQLLLEKNSNLQCIHFVGPQDEDLFKNKNLGNFKNVHTSLREVAHLLSASLFHIDNDSGVHHLAGALDVPSITVFGPTGPGTWCSMTQYNFIHWGGLSAIKPRHLLGSADRILSAYAI